MAEGGLSEVEQTEMPSLKESLIKEVEKISGVENKPSPVAGGSALHFKGKEFAHFHNDNELDLKLTKELILQEGVNHPEDSKVHPDRSAASQWIELPYESVSELREVARLVKLAVGVLKK